MNNHELSTGSLGQIEIWKLRRQLDTGEISLREFLRQAALLEKKEYENKL